MITTLTFKTRSQFTFLDVIFDFHQGFMFSHNFEFHIPTYDIYERAVHHKEFHGSAISAIVLYFLA